MPKIVLSGYFGFENAGDEAILAAMIQALQQKIPDVKLVVLSARPEVTSSRYGVSAVKRYDYRQIWSELKQADLFISGGGGLLQDVTSSRTIPYYLSLIALARFLKVKTMFYAQGIGPIKGRIGQALTAFFAGKVDLLTVRDQLSAKELIDLGVNEEKIVVTADPVLALEKADNGREILTKMGVKWEKPLLGVALRSWSCDVDYEEILLKVLKKQEAQVVLLPFHFPSDYEFLASFREKLGGDAVILAKPCSPAEYLAVTAKLDLVLGMRLHSLILAFRAAVPFVGLSYDPKVARFLTVAGGQPGLELSELTEEKLLLLLAEAFARRNEIADELKAGGLNLEKQALATAERAAALVGGTK